MDMRIHKPIYGKLLIYLLSSNILRIIRMAFFKRMDLFRMFIQVKLVFNRKNVMSNFVLLQVLIMQLQIGKNLQ